jgi:hypothetical protein
MKHRILLIVVLFVLFCQPVNSQLTIDFDKDGIPDTEDKYPFDYDNDGIPDEWEKGHGLRWDIKDAHLDRDGDGITNLQEYREGIKTKKPSVEEQLKDIPLELILLIALVVGISFIVLGMTLYFRKKRRMQKILRQRANRKASIKSNIRQRQQAIQQPRRPLTKEEQAYQHTRLKP